MLGVEKVSSAMVASRLWISADVGVDAGCVDAGRLFQGASQWRSRG